MRGKNFVKGLLATAALALAIMVTPASVVKAEEAQSTYIVERGDNLSKIAKKIYGDERLWRVIYNANSAVVKSDYIIYKNQVLIIPAVESNNNTVTPLPAVPTPVAPVPEVTTPAPEVTTPIPEAPVPETTVPEDGYTLDYNAIASWVAGGFIGVDASNSPVVMAIDAANEYAIIIFGDDSDMTAVSFVGPITYTDEYATIVDETNGLALTFSVTELNDTTLALDMGDIGTAVITAVAKDDVLNIIKIAIENYKHVA